MATITTDLICNLNQPVAVTFLHGNLFSQDNAGNTINVHVMDNGEPATIGGTVSANVIRADGATVAVSGAIEGNKAYVILSQACYAVPGRIEIIIKLTQSTTITTIAAIVANVYRSTTDTVVDPGTIIPSVQALIEEIEDAVGSIPADYSQLWESLAPGFDSGTIYVPGRYVTYDGGLYRFKNVHSGTWDSSDVDEIALGDGVSFNADAVQDIKTDLFYTDKPVFPPDVSESAFTQSSSEGYWGKKRLFDPCYIESVVIDRGTDTTAQQVSVIFCDEDYKVLKKTYINQTTDSIVNVSVGYNAEVPFYVLIRLPGMLYMQANATKYAAPTIKADFSTAGYAIPGDTITVAEESTTLEFDAKLVIVPVTERIEQNKNLLRSEFSVCPTNVWENFATGSLAGDNVWGSKMLYPAGFIKSISLMIGNTTTEDVAIYITDANMKILKKVFGYQGGSTGEFTYIVNFLAVEPVYIFVRAIGMIWINSGALFGEEYAIWSGAWGANGYKAEGETLFDSWNNSGALSTVLFSIKANYKNSEAEKYEKREKLFTLKDAYMRWLFGEKFPICVIGDSTTDGDTTTGATPNVLGTDHVDPNTYTTKLQEFLRASLNNNVLRIYNAGFSGRSVSWALQNIDAMLFDNQYYSDTKIAIISHGINDYVTSYNAERWYKGHLAQLVNVLYDAGIQPVMMTTQAGTENYNRFGWKQMSIADSITKEVAEEYNLEVMDKNTATAFFNVYSGLTIQQIIPDGCHYGDAGHLFVAGYMFKELVPYTVLAEAGETILGFDNEQIKTDLQYSSFVGYIWKDVTPVAITNGFKLKADCTKGTATTIMDFYVFVYDKVLKKLKSYCTTANGQKVVVDGTEYNVSSAEQDVCDLEIGLHHVVVTAPSGAVNYYGLKVVNR